MIVYEQRSRWRLRPSAVPDRMMSATGEVAVELEVRMLVG